MRLLLPGGPPSNSQTYQPGSTRGPCSSMATRALTTTPDFVLPVLRLLCDRSVRVPPWWRTQLVRVIGQACAVGLWTKELSSLLRRAMPHSQAATTLHRHRGVVAASILSCRAATASAITSFSPPRLSASDRGRLQQLAHPLPTAALPAASHHGLGWPNPKASRVNLATVIDRSTGQPVVHVPPKKHRQLGSATTTYQLLLTAEATRVSGLLMIAA